MWKHHKRDCHSRDQCLADRRGFTQHERMNADAKHGQICSWGWQAWSQVAQRDGLTGGSLTGRGTATERLKTLLNAQSCSSCVTFRELVKGVPLKWVYKEPENSALASTYTEHIHESSTLPCSATMLAAVASGLCHSGLCLCRLQHLAAANKN